jgi:hypothetical protein
MTINQNFQAIGIGLRLPAEAKRKSGAREFNTANFMQLQRSKKLEKAK